MDHRPYAAVLAAFALAACSHSSTGQVATEPVVTSAPPPASSTPSAVATTTAPVATMRATVYYLGGTATRPRLYREVRTVPRSTAVVRAAVEAMLHLAPLDPDYRSLWPRATTVRGISVAGTQATVDLSGNAQNVTADAATEGASLEQLVWTVTTAAPAVKSVQVRFDGGFAQTLWGHRSTLGAIARGPQEDVLGPVWINDPAQGATVPRTFTIRGAASVFEATVSWSVTTDCGTATCPVLRSGFATASTGAPGRGDFSAAVTLPATATGRVVVNAWESSADDGSVTFLDTKVVTVRP
jgi:hypothetical protein